MVERKSSMESVVMTPAFWKNRAVLVTGHTGFKGSWLAAMLSSWGARVSGIALAPKEQSLFKVLNLQEKLSSHIADIRRPELVDKIIKEERPEIVFHLAAQPLVRPSYRDPVETYSTNVMGTIHVLESIRKQPTVKTTLVVTSDKCYENFETNHAYVETDPMGGADPYSSSKGCTELIVSSWARSFWGNEVQGICTARAGNVIGGGDFAEDRLIPDCIRAFAKNEKVILRYPDSTRPWQHVLEPISGYITLAEKNYSQPKLYSGGWNFGPTEDQDLTVEKVVKTSCEIWGHGAQFDVKHEQHISEAKLLKLDCTKANQMLHWRPRLNFEKTIFWTLQWYKAFVQNPEIVESLTYEQIHAYCSSQF